MTKSRKVWLGGLGVSVLLCGVGGMGLYSGFGRPEAAFRHELELGKQSGLPADADEFQIKVDPDKNAASYYLEAISIWTKFEDSNKETAENLQFRAIGTDYPLAQAEADLKLLAPLFTKLDQAAAMPTLCFDKRYANKSQELYPELAPMRAFVRIRGLRARAFARKRDFAASFGELNQAAAIPRQIGEDNPTLIHGLAQFSLRSILFRNVELVLSEQGRNPDATSEVLALIAKIGPVPSLKRIMRGEYAGTIGTLASLDSIKSRTDLLNSNGRSEDPNVASKNAQLQLMMGWPSTRFTFESKVVKELRQGYEQMPDDEKDTVKLLTAARLASERHRTETDSGDDLLEFFYLDYSTAAELIVRSIAEERLVRALGASLSLPRGIWIPDQLVDPFCNKPFAFRDGGKTFKIWSVGPDGHDDGGIAMRPGGGPDASEKSDIVMGYPAVVRTRPPQKPSGTSPRMQGMQSPG